MKGIDQKVEEENLVGAMKVSSKLDREPIPVWAQGEMYPILAEAIEGTIAVAVLKVDECGN